MINVHAVAHDGIFFPVAFIAHDGIVAITGGVTGRACPGSQRTSTALSSTLVTSSAVAGGRARSTARSASIATSSATSGQHETSSATAGIRKPECKR